MIPQLCCDRPGCTMPGERQRQMTAYHHEESNWAILCFMCQQEADDYWRERWEDYYNSRGC